MKRAIFLLAVLSVILSGALYAASEEDTLIITGQIALTNCERGFTLTLEEQIRRLSSECKENRFSVLRWKGIRSCSERCSALPYHACIRIKGKKFTFKSGRTIQACISYHCISRA